METNTNSGAEQQNNGQELQNQQQGQEPKTFTQEEVNRIVQDRLARAKVAAEPSEKELELQQRENDIYLKERISEMAMPGEMRTELYDSLKGLDKETVDKCIKIIEPYAKKASEPLMLAVGPTTVGGGDRVRTAMGLK